MKRYKSFEEKVFITSEKHERARSLQEAPKICPKCNNQGEIKGDFMNAYIKFTCVCKCGCEWEEKID